MVRANSIQTRLSNCINQGLKLKFSAPYTPEENGKLECNWGTITPMARCLIEQSVHDKTYWAYALIMSSKIENFCFHSGIKRLPFKAMHGQKQNL